MVFINPTVTYTLNLRPQLCRCPSPWRRLYHGFDYRPSLSLLPHAPATCPVSPSSGRTVAFLTPPTAQLDVHRDPAFLDGLRRAGFLQPLDVTPSAIERRYIKRLDDLQFRDKLDLFLDNADSTHYGELSIRQGKIFPDDGLDMG